VRAVTEPYKPPRRSASPREPIGNFTALDIAQSRKVVYWIEPTIELMPSKKQIFAPILDAKLCTEYVVRTLRQHTVIGLSELPNLERRLVVAIAICNDPHARVLFGVLQKIKNK
jgi:hypothetical protein